MSVGQRAKYERRSKRQIFEILGQGDTPKLLARPYTVSFAHGIPYVGGISVDRSCVYIDHIAAEELQSGKVRVIGMSPMDVIRLWIKHEFTEKCVVDGDNPIDNYPPGHEIAQGREDDSAENDHGVPADRYESSLADLIKRCLARPVWNPPLDLWCGPYLHDPDARDEEILRAFRRFGVKDAFKTGKASAQYGVGEYQCRDCRHYAPTIRQQRGELADCEEVSGLVRYDRWCKMWTAKPSK